MCNAGSLNHSINHVIDIYAWYPANYVHYMPKPRLQYGLFKLCPLLLPLLVLLLLFDDDGDYDDNGDGANDDDNDDDEGDGWWWWWWGAGSREKH